MRLSLFWRTFALISLLLAISLGAWYQLYRAFEQPPQASRFAWEMASAINLARTALVHTQGSDREALLQALISICLPVTKKQKMQSQIDPELQTNILCL